MFRYPFNTQLHTTRRLHRVSRQRSLTEPKVELSPRPWFRRKGKTPAQTHMYLSPLSTPLRHSLARGGASHSPDAPRSNGIRDVCWNESERPTTNRGCRIIPGLCRALPETSENQSCCRARPGSLVQASLCRRGPGGSCPPSRAQFLGPESRRGQTPRPCPKPG